MAVTGWQAHSVRGFLSGAVGKKMGLAVASTKQEDRELAAGDFRLRLADVENGNSPLCPYRYAIWVRRSAGYTVLTAIEPE